MNLIHDPWIPVRRESGAEERISPWQVTESMADDPVVALASPRADFDGSLVQFLIGLLQTAFAPERAWEWRRWFDQPPAPEELREAFAPLAFAFELFGDGARFLQDLNLAQESPGEESIERLLIEAPGENTAKLGKDHFVKAGRIQGLCPACAAAALLTLQVNAPSGGQGHRTGIRGGGPLTTLVAHPRNLWSTLWLNVLEAGALPPGPPDRNRPEDRFPWLAPTRTSGKDAGHTTTGEDVDPLQVYWAMPRRLRLMPEIADPSRACDLCGSLALPLVRRYQVTNLGVNYTGAWAHPLSPHGVGANGEPFPLKGGSAEPSYRHWLGLVQTSDEGRRHPARVVLELTQRPDRQGRADYLLWAFGYDMDNMKAVAWVEGTMPLLLVSPELREAYERQVAALVLGAKQAERALVMAAKEAVTDRPKRLGGDPGDLGKRFWQETEAAFFDHLRQIREALAGATDPQPLRAAWHRTLVGAANRGFAGFCGHGFAETTDPRRAARAWNSLQRNLYGPKLLAALDLPKPERPAARSTRGTAQTGVPRP